MQTPNLCPCRALDVDTARDMPNSVPAHPLHGPLPRFSLRLPLAVPMHARIWLCTDPPSPVVPPVLLTRRHRLTPERRVPLVRAQEILIRYARRHLPSPAPRRHLSHGTFRAKSPPPTCPQQHAGRHPVLGARPAASKIIHIAHESRFKRAGEGGPSRP
jgi:hypothetical protein